MKFLLSAASIIALTTGIAAAQTSGSSEVTESQEPSATSEAPSAYEADWQGGWFVTAHEITEDSDLTRLPDTSFAKWLDSDSDWKLTDYAAYLPSERPLLLAGQYRTAYLNIAEGGTYAFRLTGTLPQHPWFSPALTCTAEMVFEGQSMISGTGILLHDTSRSKTSNISYGKEFGTKAASSWKQDSIDVELAAGLYQVSVLTNCREVTGYGDFSLYSMNPYPARRLATMLGTTGGYQDNGFDEESSLHRSEWNRKEQDIGSLDQAMGVDWSLQVSRDGEDFRSLAYDEIVNDMNELGSVSDVESASGSEGSAMVFASGGKVEELNDEWSIGFLYKGLPTDSKGLSDNGTATPLYEGATQFPLWNSFIGNGVRFDSQQATDRSAIVMESNLAAREAGNWVIAIGISGKESIDAWWRGCTLGIEMKEGRDWKQIRSDYVTFGLDGENYLMGYANLAAGIHPVRFTSTCPVQQQGLGWRDERKEVTGWANGGLKTDKDGNLQIDETGHVYKVYLKAPSDDGLRQPAATDFVIKGYPGLPSLRDAESKKSAPVKVTPKPTAPVELKTEGDLNANEIGAALQSDEVIEVNLSIEFESGSDQLTPAGKRSVGELARALNHPSLANTRFVISGHTDSDGSEEYNYDLSKRRATTVLEEMAYAHGVKLQTSEQEARGPAKSAADTRFTMQAFGENKPIASNATAEGKARNRRVSVQKVPE